MVAFLPFAGGPEAGESEINAWASGLECVAAKPASPKTATVSDHTVSLNPLILASRGTPPSVWRRNQHNRGDFSDSNYTRQR